MAVTVALPGGRMRGRLGHHAGEGQRPQRVPDHEHGHQKAEIADPVDDERLLAGVSVDLVVEPEADQQVGAEAHALPADEHHREAGPEHQHQHEHHEEIQVGEVPGVTRILLHVPDAEQMNQASHPGHDQQHDRGELVHLKRHVDLERPDREPAPEVDDDRLRAAVALEARGTAPAATRKEATSTPDADHRHHVLGLRPAERERRR